MPAHPFKILTIVGARPQFIKAAPVSEAFRREGFEHVLVHTGQHFDDSMSARFFRELGIPQPAHSLAIHSLSHGAMTGRMLEAIEQVLLAEKPAMVVVYGDTNSTLAGALAAVKLHIPVAHIEAGLRSFNRAMPEEINRIMVDHVSALHFCPTPAAVAHLKAEGMTEGVLHVGDVMMDATLHATAQARTHSQVLAQLGLTPKGYSVCTVHRAENTDDPDRFAQMMAWLDARAAALPMVLPLHPRTRQTMQRLGITPTHIRLIEPLGYLDMTWLLHHAQNAYTDSGGLQKEAYFHRVPCVTLREETEWMETVEAGWNRLWQGPDYLPRHEIKGYGTGHASDHIAAAIRRFLG